MTKSEVAKLFERIVWYYPSFTGDIEKVHAWHEFLVNVPVEVAHENLRRHIPTKNFPPTIAELTQPLDPMKEANQIYHEHLHDAAKKHFGNMEEWQKKAVPPPAHVKERMRQLAERRPI